MRLIIAGGGTGGHLYPGIAIAEEVLSKGIEVLFLVSDRGIERKILTEKKYNFIEQKVTAFKGKGLQDKTSSLFSVSKELLNLRKIIKFNDKVILLGGFASFAPGIVAVMKGAEIYIHEQNSVTGASNRFFSKYAKKFFTSFENTQRTYGKTVHTGNPVRNEISAIKCKEIFEKNILVLGGSQGSRFINKLVAESAGELLKSGYKIFHQTGDKLFEETMELYRSKGLDTSEGLNIFSYTNEIHKYYELSDIVISRSGSGSVFEITAAKRPAVYIPLKIAADNHQYYNALNSRNMKIAMVIEENNAKSKTLTDAIRDITKNFEQVYLPNLKNIKVKDSVKIIVEEMGL